MRDRVVLLGDADLRIRPLTELARQHEREHARDVGLIGHRQQVVHQPDVLLERVGHADRRVERHVARGVRFGALDASLDLTQIVEILRQRALDRARRARR